MAVKSLKPILPIRETPDINKIKQIQPLQAIQPIYGFKSIQSKKDAYYKNQKQIETFLANYNDPTELNSYIDALTNREAVSKKFGETWGTLSTISGTVSVLSFAGAIIAAALAPVTGGASLAVAAPLAKAGAVAAIPAVPAAVDVTVEKGIKPIVKGKPKEAFLNTLMNLGETMDFAANPVKGLILEGPEGFIKGTGLGEGGRVNYDYDTGSFITDMLLELVSDPMNWVDFGTGTALKSATKSVGEAFTKNLIDPTIKTVNRELLEKGLEIGAEGAERITKQVTKTTSRVSREWASKSFDKLSDAAKNKLLYDGRKQIQQSLVQAIRKEAPELTVSELDIILRKANYSVRTGQFIRSTANQIQDITFDTLSTDVIKGLAGMQHYSDMFQKFMTKGAMFTSGYGLGVELAKYGWKGINAWQNNYTLSKLTQHHLFDRKNGLNIKHWESAKNIWQACQDITEPLAGKSQRDMQAFYTFATQQFARDKQLIQTVLDKYKTDVVKQAVALDAQFQALYNCSFKDYIAYIKNINKIENGAFQQFSDFADAINLTLSKQALAKPLGASVKTGVQLFAAQSVDSLKKMHNNLIAELVQPTTLKNFKKLYTVKLNDAFVNALLVNDPTIAPTLMEIAGSEKVGAFLNKVLGDANARLPEVSAQIVDAVRTIKNAGNSFTNIKQLYDDVGGAIFSPINKVTDTEFKRYVIDQIFGIRDKSVTELLAGFDTITLPKLMYNLEFLLGDVGFKVSNYPGLEAQIGQIYKKFLEAQQRAGLETVDAAIVQNFTNSLDDLMRLFPEYANELAELNVASTTIRNTLATVRDTNLEYLENILLAKDSIFNVANTRQLTDVGLALKTVADTKNLSIFEIPADVSSNTYLAMDRLGKSINNLATQLKQYTHVFDYESSERIRNAFNAVRRSSILEGSPLYDAFRYVKDTDAPTMFAYLVELNKALAGDKINRQHFRDLMAEHLVSNTWYMRLQDPRSLMVTDYAWDAMKQSAWIAEKELNESLINTVTAYKDLSLTSKKITNDFQALKDLLSANKLDRPLMLKQERYIKAVSKINDMLEFLENHYNSRFNRTVATNQITQLREILINFPELNERYTDLVDTLEAYWRGEKTFQQSHKAARGSADYVDEFTPFWNEIKDMNTVIQNAVRRHNEDVANGVISQTKQFKYNPVTPWDPIKEQQQLNKLINQATNLNAQGSLTRLLSLTPDELIEELAYRNRFVTFRTDDLANKHMSKLYDKLRKQSDKSKVHFINDTTRNRIWIVLDEKQKVNASGRQYYLNSIPIQRPRTLKQFNEFKIVDDYINDANNPGIMKTLNELDNTLYELTGSHLGESQGEYFSENTIRELFKIDSNGIPVNMPQEVYNLFPKIDGTNDVIMLDKQFHNAYIFNESIMGSMSSKASLGMYSGNMITNARNAIVQAQCYTKAKTEYVATVFDSQFSIANPNGIFASYSENDLLAALQANPEYKLVTLVDDKKHGLKTREILPTSVDAIRKAKELGAVVIPSQTYKDMYNVVNHRLGATGVAKWWSRLMYIYKFGYLMRPGAWLRNFIDTNIKSRLEMGDEYLSYYNQASKYLEDIHRMKTVIEHRDIDGLTRQDAIQQWFAQGSAKHLTYEQFVELDKDFLSQGISGNIMRDVIVGDEDGIWKSFTKWSGDITDAVNKTEEVNRLAMYLYGLDQGYYYNDILSKIAKTHFDYSFKTKAEQLLDMVFPFSTFSLRNYSYWIEMIEKHPWILRNYAHLMKPHWDFKDYTPEELATNYRVQTQIQYGQLKLAEFNDKVITFKANPSIQDALQMFSDPINNIYEKLAAPFAVPKQLATGQYTNPLNLVPGVGPAIQAAQTMQKTKTPMPSLIGVSKTPRRTGVNFRNKNLNQVNTFKDKQYRVPTYRKNVVYDSYALKGIKQYRVNLYPIIDIAHDVKSRYSINVYNKIKNKVKTDVYQGIRYRIRLDANRFR